MISRNGKKRDGVLKLILLSTFNVCSLTDLTANKENF